MGDNQWPSRAGRVGGGRNRAEGAEGARGAGVNRRQKKLKLAAGLATMGVRFGIPSGELST